MVNTVAMDDANADEPYRLTLKGTFIDAIHGQDDNSDLSPRASSDPGSVSSSYSAHHFQAEQAYISTLSSKISRRSWNSNRSNDGSNEGKPETSIVAVLPSKPGFTTKKDVSMTSSIGSASSSSMDPKPFNIPAYAEKQKMDRDELKVTMRRKAAEVPTQRLCNALTSIQEIPEQVGEVFQQTATDLVDEVNNEVFKARQLIAAKVEDPATSTEVATQVGEIPDMVKASFEVSFAKAMSHVRVRVQDVIQVLEATSLESDEVVQHLWAIPEEVRQITREAVKEASEASQDRVVEQLDYIMQNISEDKKTEALTRAKQNIIDSVPHTLPVTVRRIAEVTQNNVQQATEVVVEQGMGDCGYVANRVVADILLRAKAEGGGDSLPEEVLNNPGSKGHPELCSRACLYYPLGKCTNGQNCAFCHAPHAKRATHLDKRHRQMLGSMDFTARLCLILPILKAKLESLELDRCRQETCRNLLTKLSEINGSEPRAPIDKKSAKQNRTLQTALRFMSARSLAALLYNSSVPKALPQSEAVESLLQLIRPSLPGGSGGAFSRSDALDSRMSEMESESGLFIDDDLGRSS